MTYTIGSITFWVKVVSYVEMGTECFFTFLIDNDEVLRVTTVHLDYHNITFTDIPAGEHTFTWQFLQIDR